MGDYFLVAENFSFSEDNSSLADNTNSNELSNDSLKEKIRSIPSQISESQKLLKTSIFQMPAPQYPTKCLILNIYKIKQPQYEDKSTSPPPPAELSSDLQQPLQEREQLQSERLKHDEKTDNNLQTSWRIESNKRFAKVETSGEGVTEEDDSDERGRELNENVLKEVTRQEEMQTLLSRRENRIPIEANTNSLTPRSRSKFEHLIKTLSYSNEEEQLVLYKVLQSPPLGGRLKITESVPYKGEPKVSIAGEGY